MGWIVVVLLVYASSLWPSAQGAALDSLRLSPLEATIYVIFVAVHALNELGAFGGPPLRDFLNGKVYAEGTVEPYRGPVDALGAFALSLGSAILAVNVHAGWILVGHGKDLADAAQHFYQYRSVRGRNTRYAGPDKDWEPALPASELGLVYFLTTLPMTLFIGAWLLLARHVDNVHAHGSWVYLVAGAAVIAVSGALYVRRSDKLQFG